jgi:hypothetical protein
MGVGDYMNGAKELLEFVVQKGIEELNVIQSIHTAKDYLSICIERYYGFRCANRNYVVREIKIPNLTDYTIVSDLENHNPLLIEPAVWSAFKKKAMAM